MDFNEVGKTKKFQLNELEKLRLDKYENTKLYNERIKIWNNKCIIRREFKERELVLLFNYGLRLFFGKLCSRWSGPFHVKKVMPSGSVEVMSESTGSFMVNRHQLKHYVICEEVEKGVCFTLKELP